MSPEHKRRGPVYIGDSTTFAMGLRNILLVIGFICTTLVAATTWAVSQTRVADHHTEQIIEIQTGVQNLATQVAKEHELLRDLQADRREMSVKLDYLVSGRRGTPPPSSTDR